MTIFFSSLSGGSLFFKFLILLLTAALIDPVVAGPACFNYTITVTASTNNAYLPPTASLSYILGLPNYVVGTALNNLVGGNFDIATTYCEPETLIPSRKNTLQVLIHGGTYTRSYWFGLYRGDRYSWVAAASKQGYPTLSVDRLGNGDSQRADPIAQVQFPLQAETIHQIILKARAGVSPFPRKFSNIILAGHSLGSICANAINTYYPQDANATILTGYSSYLLSAVPGAITQITPLPAFLLDPARFSKLNIGYLMISLRFGFNYVFYGKPGTFDQSMQDYDWATRGTLSIGEAATLLIAPNVASYYTGPVHFMTAEYDAAFCNVGALPLEGLLGLLGLKTYGCTTSSIQYLKNSESLYPVTSNFSYYAPPTAGHCWHLHYDALAAFAEAHQWLASQGY